MEPYGKEEIRVPPGQSGGMMKHEAIFFIGEEACRVCKRGNRIFQSDQSRLIFPCTAKRKCTRKNMKSAR